MAQTPQDLDVRTIAALARLDLTPEEIDRFSRQLRDVLAYAAQVQQVDTTGVPPTSHPLANEPVWREDVPTTSLDRATVLQQAPDASIKAGLFKVPKVL